MTFSLMSLRAAIANILLAPRSFLLDWFASNRPLASDDLSEITQLASWSSDAKAHRVSEDTGKTALLISMMTLPYGLKMETLMARALQRRGYSIVVLTNIASYGVVKAYHQDLNGFEIRVLENYIRLKHVRVIFRSLNKLLTSDENLLQRVKAFRYRNAYTGLHSLATISSAATDGRIAISKQNLGRLRRTLRRSMHLTDAVTDLIEEIRPTVALSIEKGFVGTAEVFYAALNAGVDYVQWTGCHEPNSLMLKRYSWENFREHPFSISSRGWLKVLTLPWAEKYRDGVMEQFTRGYQEGEWFRYKSLATDQKLVTRQELLSELGLDSTRKTAVIYSHILNDANLFYGEDLFSGGYEEWLVETVRAASENGHVNWVLKLHPSNVYRNAKLGYKGEYGEILALKQAFGEVPDFLRVVYPEEKTSPFSFFQITDFGVTVRGTVGLELPCFGVPVLTAGTGRYSGKGFTIDSDTRHEYLAKIRTIHEIPALSEEKTRLGQRYAYFVFRARPARYGDMFSDVYNFPLNHPRYRDIALGATPLDALLDHPQMQKIINFLCSDEEDFLDLSTA